MALESKSKNDAGGNKVVEVLDLDASVSAAEEVHPDLLNENSCAVGIIQQPCHIDMSEKQNHCYNVQKMTKDKASSSAQS